MTKPKVYPEGLTKLFEVEYRFQGGSFLRLYFGPDLIEVARKYAEEGTGGMLKWWYLGYCTQFSSFWFSESVVPRSKEKKVRFRQRLQLDILRRESFDEISIKRIVLGYAVRLAYDLGRCPYVAELRMEVLKRGLPDCFASWIPKLSEDEANQHMRDLMVQCALSWLPKKIAHSEVRSFRVPHNSKGIIKKMFPDFLFSHLQQDKAKKLMRYSPKVTMWIQLPPDYQEPEKRGRGRPRKSE